MNLSEMSIEQLRILAEQKDDPYTVPLFSEIFAEIRNKLTKSNSTEEAKNAFYDECHLMYIRPGHDYNNMSNYDDGAARLEYFLSRVDQTNNTYLKAVYCTISWQNQKKDNWVCARMAIESHKNLGDFLIDKHNDNDKNDLYLYRALEHFEAARLLALELNDRDTMWSIAGKMLPVIYKELELHKKLYGTKYVESFVQEKDAQQNLNFTDIRNRIETQVSGLGQVGPGYNDTMESLLNVIEATYKAEKNDAEVKNTKRRKAEAHESMAEFWNDKYPLLTPSILERAIKIYNEIGDSEKVKQLISAKTEAHQSITQDHYGSVNASTEIPEAAIAEWLSFYANIPIDDFLIKMANDPNLLPNYSRAEDHANNLGLMGVFPIAVYSKDRSLRNITDANEKIEYHKQSDFQRAYQLISQFFLPLVFELLRNNYDFVSDTVKFVKRSPVIENERLAFFETALRRFEKKDYISCMHILAPQIEGILRGLLATLSGHKYHRKSEGEYEYKTLGSILDELENEYGMDRSLIQLIRLFLGEKTADNLRNDIGHGEARSELFTEHNSMLMIYIVIKIAAWIITDSSQPG